MMNRQLQTVTLRPHVLQLFVQRLHLFVMGTIGAVYTGLADRMDLPYRTIVLGLTLVIGLLVLYSFIELWRTTYIITAERLIYKRGVFKYSVDYIELYRVVDYGEDSSFLQQLLGLKTVTILSGDRTRPKLTIPGVLERVDLVGFIRERVELNKNYRGVYEITNR